MTELQLNNVKNLIDRLSDRVGTCENPVDRQLMAEAVGYFLLLYASGISKYEI